MKKIFIIANWKSNKTVSESTEWIQKVLSIKYNVLSSSNKEVVVCPSFTLIPALKSYILNHESSIKIGAQDVSPFDEGAYTGEVSAKQIKELADYIIIGHSERRRYFGEDEDIVAKKIAMAIKCGLIPILCISNLHEIQSPIQSGTKLKIKEREIIVAYEPLFAIGSGQADTSENADNMADKIKNELGNIPVLYGGSVASNNVRSFTQMPHIDGVLVGSASLDPLEFLEIIRNA